jgi:peroxiredoxin (alkyl hydroperoxide reductase subunit C)
MRLLPQQKAPSFTADAVIDGAIQRISLADYEGKYVLLMFYPWDFGLVCPTEIIAFSDRYEEFYRRKAEIIAVSVDSPHAHLAWCRTPRSQGGLETIAYPIVSDLTKAISRDYGVLLNSQGVALRGLFLIDREGVIRHLVVNDLPLGRSVNEALRMLIALQEFERHGELCPANWRPGLPTIKADPVGTKSYFIAVANASRDLEHVSNGCRPNRDLP